LKNSIKEKKIVN